MKTQSQNPPAPKKGAHTPNYQVLDEYNADLLNENPPRREEVAEIQDREEGDLLCYACPRHAAFIVEACNNYTSLQSKAALADQLAGTLLETTEALKEARRYLDLGCRDSMRAYTETGEIQYRARDALQAYRNAGGAK